MAMSAFQTRHTAVHIHSGRTTLGHLRLESDRVDPVGMETLVDGFRHDIKVRIVGQSYVNGR